MQNKIPACETTCFRKTISVTRRDKIRKQIVKGWTLSQSWNTSKDNVWDGLAKWPQCQPTILLLQHSNYESQSQWRLGDGWMVQSATIICPSKAQTRHCISPRHRSYTRYGRTVKPNKSVVIHKDAICRPVDLLCTIYLASFNIEDVQIASFKLILARGFNYLHGLFIK